MFDRRQQERLWEALIICATYNIRQFGQPQTNPLPVMVRLAGAKYAEMLQR
jgi:hypothetical protein